MSWRMGVRLGLGFPDEWILPHHSGKGMVIATQSIDWECQASVLGPLLFLLYIKDLAVQLELSGFTHAGDFKGLGTSIHEGLARDKRKLHDGPE